MTKNKIFRSFLFIFIVILYFFSRLQNLTSIPVFGDEAIYIRWAQIIKSEETLRFIPQTDGKQPLFMWFNALSLKFIADPLVSGRIISVLAGFGITLLLFFTVATILNFQSSEKNIFKFIQKSISIYFYPAIFTSLVYCLLPFAFFFDRLALADTLLSFFGLTSLLFSLLLSKYPRLDLSLILGAILGLAWLTKSPAIYFIVLSIGTFIILKKKTTIYDLISTIYLPLISSIIAFIIYNILRLGPQFNMIYSRNRDYVWSLGEIIKHPLDPLKPHLSDTITLYHQYISWPILILALLGIITYFYQKNKFKKEYLILISWWLLPLIATATIAKVFTARYILFTIPSLIIILALSIFYLFSQIKSSLIKIILLISIFVLNINFICKISIDPIHQNLPSTETGYLSDWTSGWGINQSAIYLKEQSKKANVIVGTEGNFGTLPDGLQIYTNHVPQLTVIGLGLGFTSIPTNLANAKEYGDEVYILINKSRLKINSSDVNKMKLIRTFEKPKDDQLLLYQL